MGGLVRFELEKLLKKKLVVFSMAVFGIIYATMLWSWIGGSEWASNKEGEMLFGREATAYNEEIIARYNGPLTDEKVQNILNEFKPVGERTTGNVSNSTYYPIGNLFADRSGQWNGLTVGEVFPEFEEPPLLGRSSRWESFLYSMMYIIMSAGIIVIIVVSPIFSEEYGSGMDALILTSRYGKKRCVRAKIIASFCFVFIYMALVIGFGFLAFFMEKGMAGWDADIQLSEMMNFTKVTQPLKSFEAACYMVALSLASVLTLNGLVLFFSVISKTSFISVIASAVVYLLPMFLSPGSQMGKRILFLLPVNSISVSGVLTMGEVNLGHIKLQQETMVIILMAVVTALSFGLCRTIFSRHQVTG